MSETTAPEPTSGGSYARDPVTGALTRVTDEAAAEQAAPATPATETE